MSEDKRPPRLVRDAPADPDTRLVTFRLLVGQPITVMVDREKAQEIHQEMSATWRGSERHTFTLNHPGGSQLLINPAHVVFLEIR